MIDTFKPWKYYRHKKCLDIDIAVISIKEVDDGIEAVVAYWNRAWQCFQGKQDIIFINKKDFQNWSECGGID